MPAERDLAAEVRAIFEGEAVPTMILPALRTFKLRVRLRFTDRAAGSPGPETPPGADGGGDPAAPVGPIEPVGPVEPARLQPFERALLARLEDPLPLVPRPWAELAAGLRVSERRLLAAVGSLKRRGVVRRVAAVLRHRQAGFRANAMVCFRVPEDRIPEAGRRAAGLPAVSHCYQRQTAPQWPYSLYAMLHARSREECDGLVRELAGLVGCGEYQLLYSRQELKKRRVKHFGDKP
jgi:DNA-binding Lrp family transcriptional regulator